MDIFSSPVLRDVTCRSLFCPLLLLCKNRDYERMGRVTCREAFCGDEALLAAEKMLNLFLMAAAESWRDWAEMMALRLKLEQSISSPRMERPARGRPIQSESR